MSDTIKVTELVKLNIKPNEVLVLRMPKTTTREQLQNFRQVMVSLKPDFKVLVLPEDVKLEVVSAGIEESKPSICEDCTCGKAGGCNE